MVASSVLCVSELGRSAALHAALARCCSPAARRLHVESFRLSSATSTKQADRAPSGRRYSFCFGLIIKTDANRTKHDTKHKLLFIHSLRRTSTCSTRTHRDISRCRARKTVVQMIRPFDVCILYDVYSYTPQEIPRSYRIDPKSSKRVGQFSCQCLSVVGSGVAQ